MARPYSLDLRERVVGRILAGETVRAAAAAFAVSVSAAVKWSQRFRATGSAAAAKMGGRKPVKLAPYRDFVRACFAEEPHLTLRGLQRQLAARGVAASYGAVWKFVHDEGLSFKKNRARGRAGSSRRRQAARAMEEISGAHRS
jgi:transposase